MDDALRRQLTTLDRLWAELNAAGRGVRGGRAFRVVLEGRDHRDGKLESKLEAKLLVILRRIKDHRFEVQVPIAVNGKNYRIDFYESTRRLGVEGQGVRWHLGTERTKRDWERHNKLSLAGLTMLYYTWDDVHFRPKEVEAEIRAMLRPVPSVMPALN